MFYSARDPGVSVVQPPAAPPSPPVRPLPPGSPEGWFFLTRAAQLGAGGVREVRLAGEHWVLWRDASGSPRLHSAWCPHLGAHLGQGGTVRDGRLICPFHGFAFDPEGRCVATGYGTPPPKKATLPGRPVIERDGLLFGWSGQGAPAWAPDEVGAEGWSPFQVHQWELRAHPQEVTENSVDVGHFSHVHGYRAVSTVTPAEAEGACLRTAYRFEKPVGGRWAPETIRITVWGLGYSRVEVEDEWVGARFRLLVLPTPLDTDRLRLSIALSVQDPDRSPRPAWRWLPRWAARHVVAPLALRAYARDVESDFRIWSHKAWMARPALAEGDGPIGLYRAWVRQFYPSPEAP